MAKRILSADSALMPSTQATLGPSVRTEPRAGLLAMLQERWAHALALRGGEVLFDWDDQQALMAEIAFLNRAQAALDEAAVKLAPAMLRVVLTVKANLPTPVEQRAFLAEHMQMDFRRISELCIVADSYGLLEAELREEGARELAHYGWSNALKLAYVRGPHDRRDIWERACGGRPAASYRAVLQEIRHYRERKLVAPPPPEEEIETRLSTARRLFTAFSGVARNLRSQDDLREALHDLEQVQRELGRLKRVLKEQIEAADVADMAASA